MKSLLSALFLSVSLLVCVGCSTYEDHALSHLSSHATQRWSVSANAGQFLTVAESGACATNLPASLLVNNYCFNEIPVAEVSSSLSSSKFFIVCVATHLPGTASEAALIVVDSRGRSVGDAMGRGQMQVVASIAEPGTFKVYVGFPSAAAGQRVKVLAGLSDQFSISSASCSFR